MSLSMSSPVASPACSESSRLYDLPSYSATTLTLPSYSSGGSNSYIHERLFAPKRSFVGLIKQLCGQQARKQAKAAKAQGGELTEDERKIAQTMVDQYWDKCISMGY